MEGLYVRECEKIQVCEHLEDSRDWISRVTRDWQLTKMPHV